MHIAKGGVELRKLSSKTPLNTYATLYKIRISEVDLLTYKRMCTNAVAIYIY